MLSQSVNDEILPLVFQKGKHYLVYKICSPAVINYTTQLFSFEQEECSRPQEEEDIMDIPLDDPEANRAAAKIQAGFRGHMTRKKMKPEDKTEGEEVSSTGDALNSSQGVSGQCCRAKG